MDWQRNILTSAADIRELLGRAKRVAVLGIRPETYPHKPAFYVPAALAEMGLEIVPVPILNNDVDVILGQPVYRALADVPGPIDIVDVFRRAEDIPAHVPDIFAKMPYAVWFQSGIRNDAVAEQLAKAGIKVVQNRCLMVDHRNLAR